ncbi:hypothetical protein, partial [Vibrio harveyi]
MKWNEMPTSASFHSVKAVHTPDRMVSKFTFLTDDEKALYEGHWWKKYDDIDCSIYLSTHSGCPVGCRMCGTNSYH